VERHSGVSLGYVVAGKRSTRFTRLPVTPQRLKEILNHHRRQ
jgi:hypothetical protein